MLNEEISNEVLKKTKDEVMLAYRMFVRPTAETLIGDLKETVAASEKAKTGQAKDPKGEMTVKQLIDKDQGATSVDISELGLRDFKRTANKYGLDFAIVKSRDQDPSVYTVFFKAKDTDVINNVVAEYTAKQMKRDSQKRPSVRAMLTKFKEMLKNAPHKEHEKRKEQER